MTFPKREWTAPVIARQLASLALDLRWSWDHASDDVWRRLEPELWTLTGNPWLVLQTVSSARLESLGADPAFRAQVDTLARAAAAAVSGPTWFDSLPGATGLSHVAYFSMEFMLCEALAIYSGGLGNVAGDQLKAASDLGVPVVGIGLLYQQGYFRQLLADDGSQQAVYPFNDPGQLPVTPVLGPTGDWLRLTVELGTFRIWVRVWQAQVGRARLYLLDTNDPANPPSLRPITGQLYGGGLEIRLAQEIVLGIGGWRALWALGMRPDVCHLNEGHAALAVLERARTFMAETGHSFAVALAATRAGNLFTTHTPVDAGFDRFRPALVARALGSYAERQLGLSLDDLLALGRRDPADPEEPFTTAYLAIRGCGAVNGVSRLHGAVSRRLFQPLFPRWPATDVPISHVTNGIHVPTWDSVPADELWTAACGAHCWHGSTGPAVDEIRRVPAVRLWAFRNSARRQLVEYLRRRLARQLAAAGASDDEVRNAGDLLDPDALTLGFARRFAAYKRPNLILRDPVRLARLLGDRGRPVQLIVAGKAHPADAEGLALVREWNAFVRRADVRGRALFVSDYDLPLAMALVGGVDLWINTPRRPWEASGTSGMKVLVNGGLNLSQLDGWWAEAYAPDVGWALGNDGEPGEIGATDAADAETLYGLLEDEIVPAFYARDASGLPTGWVARMRESMARLTPVFAASRVVREYTERYYLPAAAARRRREADKGALAVELVDWRDSIARAWPSVKFGAVQVSTRGEHHAVSAQVHLADLAPDAVRVELHTGSSDGGQAERYTMTNAGRPGGPADGWLYVVEVPADRPAAHYTARVVPHHPELSVPLEVGQIVWQR